MAETPLNSRETPEEVLESEIKELEKRTLNSAWLWGAAALALVLLSAAAFLITFWDNRQSAANRVAVAPEAMVLNEPKGIVDRDLTFRWEKIDDAASYILLVKAVEGDEVEILRPVRDTFLKPSETEVSNLNPGAYVWTIEARSSKGLLIGYGEGLFTIPKGD